MFPYRILETVLDNGLRVVAIPMDVPGIAAHCLAVRAGSRNEVEPGLSGFAHFFEHMMFRGTERFSPEAYNDVLKRLGADSNAFTTDDWTCYHVTAPAAALRTVMEIEADRFMHLRYSVEAFQKEARAVLGEYNKNRSIPVFALFEALHGAAFERHTYRHTTMGFLADVEDMPNQYAYSLEFFRRWYRPDNAALFVAGDVEADAVFEEARRRYGPWTPGAATVEIPVEPPQKAEKRLRLAWPNPTLPHLLLGYHVPAFDPGRVADRALDVLAEAAFSETSPLHKDLVLERQWAESLWGGRELHRDPPLFHVLVRVKDPVRMADVVERIDAELRRLARKPLPAARLASVKSHLRYAFLRSLDTPDRVAAAVAEFWQLTGDTGSVERTYSALDGVSGKDVSRAAAEHFSASNRTMATLAHEGRDPA